MQKRRYGVSARVFLLLLVAPCAGGGEEPVFRHGSFEDFSAGTVGNAGHNLFVSRSGEIRFINWFDFDNDGYPEVMAVNDHNHYDNVDLFVYAQSPAGGFTSLRPPMAEDMAEYQRMRHLVRAMEGVTKLPSLGAGRMTVADLNGNGWPDLVVTNFSHGWSNEHFPVFVYWGGPGGYRPERRMDLPTLGGAGVAAADLNGSGRVDLVIANQGREHRLRDVNATTREQRQASLQPDESFSYLYWNAETGFSDKNRLEIPTEYAVDVKIADLSRNGFPDIAFLQAGTDASVRIYFNGPNGFSEENRVDLEGFDSPWSYATREMLLADFNGNGWIDIFVPSDEGQSRIFWNTEGEFRRAEEIETFNALSAQAADLNGDGFNDLVIANYSRGERYEVSSFIYWGGQDGFSPERRTELPTVGATSVKLADLNGNGFHDIVFSNQRTGETFDVSSFIYWGSESGYQPYRRQELATFGAVDVAVFDSNRSGLKDLVFANRISGEAHAGALDSYVFWGNPEGAYSEADVSRIPPVRNEAPVAAGDLTGNDHADLVFASGNGETLTIVYGEGRAFDRVETIEIPFPGRAVLLADVNRDGYLDIFVGSGSTEELAIVYGSPEGFGEMEVLTTGLPHYGAALGDVNGNGHLDLALAGFYGIRLIFAGADGAFAAGDVVDLETGIFTAKVALADLNESGYPDLVAFQAYDRETFLNDMGTVIFWNNAGRFSTEESVRLESFRALHGSVADVTGDGRLEIVVPNYHGGTSRDVDTYIYYRGDDGLYRDDRRRRLQAYSGSANLVLDLNSDGFKDIIVYNHSKSNRHTGFGARGGVHGVGSFIYWGGPNGHSVDDRSWFPTFGPHNRISVDPGDLLRRRDYEEYVSSKIDVRMAPARSVFELDADMNDRHEVRLFVRAGNDAEEIEDQDWQQLEREETEDGTVRFAWLPSGSGTYVKIQYKIHLDSGGSGTGPVIRQVTLLEAGGGENP